MTDSELKLRLDAVRAGDMTAFEEIYNYSKNFHSANKTDFIIVIVNERGRQD